jgi:hypothetical protein
MKVMLAVLAMALSVPPVFAQKTLLIGNMQDLSGLLLCGATRSARVRNLQSSA